MECGFPRATCDTSVYFALERVPEVLLMSPEYLNRYKILQIRNTSKLTSKTITVLI